MAKITSHLVNAADGTHAEGIDVELFGIGADGNRVLLDTRVSDGEGRFAIEVGPEGFAQADSFELVLKARPYFAARGQNPKGKVVVRDVVVRFDLPEPDDRYHFPIILAPNACSIWWAS